MRNIIHCFIFVLGVLLGYNKLRVGGEFMSVFLCLAYLFFIGSVLGWLLEVFFRKFFSDENPDRKWINPGFCTGPYLPIYGSGLSLLYIIASLGTTYNLDKSLSGKIFLFLIMSVSMTLIEYIAGAFSIKYFKTKLWDYRGERFNYKGIICLKFSIYWAGFGALYYFVFHHNVIHALDWLENNLGFSFVIGYFFGVLSLDLGYTIGIVGKLRKFAIDNDVIVRYERLKLYISDFHERNSFKSRFLFPFKSEISIIEHLKEAENVFDEIKKLKLK